MSTSASPAARLPGSKWLMERGPNELEQLFRAIIFHPSAPILITDDDRNSHEASTGAARLLGLPRGQILGHKLDDFAEPRFKPQVSELWRAFMSHGQQGGVLRLKSADGQSRGGIHRQKQCIAGSSTDSAGAARYLPRWILQPQAPDTSRNGSATTRFSCWIRKVRSRRGTVARSEFTVIPRPRRWAGKLPFFLLEGAAAGASSDRTGQCSRVRPFRRRRLAETKRWIAILGQHHHYGTQK